MEVKIIADSVSPEGKRITTMQLRYPRFIHAEFMTHRVFSRNASSSRAIPVKKMIEQIRNEPATPVHWGLNQPGMQANEELAPAQIYAAKALWNKAALVAANIAEDMMELGLHKQVANRILEPFQYIGVVVTATEWENFFALRAHKDAQPEIRMLAEMMLAAMNESEPTPIDESGWHLPYVTREELNAANGPIQRYLDEKHGAAWFTSTFWEVARKVSAARCCRVSYLKHDGHPATIEEDIALCDRLAGAEPIHASPFEHQARPVCSGAIFDRGLMGNFKGWEQYRKFIERQFSK